MVQKVTAPDAFGNQAFRWDNQQNVISVVHDGNVLFYKLSDDNEFHFIRSEAKSKTISKKHTA
jgi:hypothetical protein